MNILRTPEVGASMEFVLSGKYSTVYYDRGRKVYIKTFSPKRFDRLRYFLHIRPYPGKNFALVAHQLTEQGIRVPEILIAENYYLETRDIEGSQLRELLPDHPELQEKFVELIVTLFRAGIHCRGLNTKNFIVRDEELYAIDLDAYKAAGVIKFPEREFLENLKRAIKGPEAYLYDRIIQKLGIEDAP
ncbi:hypothetical protein [Cernens ardua]|uniref:hypothetical protein n=1 Tax=Cernens ardua TaxID=3402176 RepID=UPI003F9BD8F7